MAENGSIRVYQGTAGTRLGTLHKADHVGRHALELLSGLLENPEAADILEEADLAVNTSLIGKIQGKTLLTYNRFGSLDAEERPGTATQICEVPVTGRNGCHGGCGVVTGHGNYRNRTKTGGFLNLWRYGTHNGSRLYKPSKLPAPQTEDGEDFRVQIPLSYIHKLGRGGNGIFADSLTGKHIGQCVRGEENLVRDVQSPAAVAPESVELEHGIEVHELDSSAAVQLPGRHFFEE